MGVEPKIGVVFPPKSSIFIGFPLFSPSILGFFPLFLETSILFIHQYIHSCSTDLYVFQSLILMESQGLVGLEIFGGAL